MFILVEYEKDVLEARKVLIDNLNAQKEVETVQTVYVDKNEAFVDVDHLRWNSVDILLSSEENEKVWKDLNFFKMLPLGLI